MIQLTRASEYALRGIQFLAGREPGQVCMVSEISAAQGVPESVLAKIFQSLARAGIVTSHRGAGGGFSLARPAAEITLLEIIEATEGPITIYDCVSDNSEHACPDGRRAGCTILPIFHEAVRALHEVFGRRTAADLACEACSTEPALSNTVAN